MTKDEQAMHAVLKAINQEDPLWQMSHLASAMTDLGQHRAAAVFRQAATTISMHNTAQALQFDMSQEAQRLSQPNTGDLNDHQRTHQEHPKAARQVAAQRNGNVTTQPR